MNPPRNPGTQAWYRTTTATASARTPSSPVAYGFRRPPSTVAPRPRWVIDVLPAQQRRRSRKCEGRQALSGARIHRGRSGIPDRSPTGGTSCSLDTPTRTIDPAPPPIRRRGRMTGQSTGRPTTSTPPTTRFRPSRLARYSMASARTRQSAPDSSGEQGGVADRTGLTVGNHRAQPVEHRAGVGRGAPGQRDRELLTAPAGDHVGLTQHALGPCGEVAQQQVAVMMAVGVVVQLEVVEIDQGQRQGSTALPRRRGQLPQSGLPAPSGSPGRSAHRYRPVSRVPSAPAPRSAPNRLPRPGPGRPRWPGRPGRPIRGPRSPPAHR